MSSSDSSLSSSLASSAGAASPPAAAAAPPEAAPPAPPEGTEASLPEPSAMSCKNLLASGVVAHWSERSLYLRDVLALKLRDERVQALVVSLDTDGGEDGLDIGGRGGGVATEAEEEVSCEMLHFEGCLSGRFVVSDGEPFALD